MNDSNRFTNEEYVVHPELMPYVEAARNQSVDSVRVTAEDVRAGWSRRRMRRRGGYVAAVMSLAAAAALIWMVDPGTTTIEAPVANNDVEQPAPEANGQPTEEVVEPVEQRAPNSILSTDDGVIMLAEVVRVESEADSPEPKVLGPFELELAAGSYRVGVDAGADQPLQIGVGGRTLRVDEGQLHIDATGSVPVVRLESGVAAWVSEDGTVEPLQVVETVTIAKSEPTAHQLAHLAEKRMSQGDDAGAIEALQTLLRKYPRSAPARTATFDLGRLLERKGRKDEARCAYGSFLSKWPSSSLRADVERKLDRLGEGPACRGLKPRG